MWLSISNILILKLEEKATSVAFTYETHSTITGGLYVCTLRTKLANNFIGLNIDTRFGHDILHPGVNFHGDRD